jgi:hypothetical protein
MGRESRRKIRGADERRAEAIRDGRIVEHADGGVTVTLTPGARAMLLQQRLAFIDKFGRQPTATDPVFFDPDADTPQQLSNVKIMEALEQAARATGIDVGRAIEHVFGRQELDDYRKTQ